RARRTLKVARDATAGDRGMRIRWETPTFARRTGFRVRCLLLRLWCGRRGCRGRKRAHAKSEGAEHYTAAVDRTHDHVQHRVTLDRRCSVVRGDQKLQHHEGDRDRPAADGSVRPERLSYHHVHRQIPKGYL